MVSWLFLAAELARAGVFEVTVDRLVPMIGVGTGLPILLGLLAMRYSTSFQAVLRAIPIHKLIAVQVYRTIGFVFLIGLSAGLLPGVFAWPAGVGDIIVGLLAPLVAWRALKHPGSARGAIWAWSILGIGDLILALSLGTLSSPVRIQLFAMDAPNVAISAYPLVMVPIFAVPVSILLHAAVILKLRAARRGTGDVAPAAA